MRLFQQRKPTETKEWQQKLPDFVLRLEEAVYRGARSKVRDVRFPFARRFFHDEKRRLGFNSVVSPGVFHRARVFARLFGNAKKSRVCDCRAEPPPEARATPRSRDARRRTRPPLASSDACVGGSARRTRDRAANATRTNRLFVYAPPKPSARRRFFREYAMIVSTPRVSSPAPRARYDAIRQHARSRALNTALCPS